MKEDLPQATIARKTGPEKRVCIYIDAIDYAYTGNWQWDLQSDAVFCSDVMLFLPETFEGTKGIIHPDDKARLHNEIVMHGTQEIPFLQFRIITTYGEVKTLTGSNLQASAGAVFNDTVLQQQERIKNEVEELEQGRRLAWQKRAAELAERHTATGTWYINANTHEMYYSDEVFRIYGLPRQSLNPHLHTFSPFIHPDEREIVTDAITKSIKERIPLHLQYRVLTPAGQEKLLHLATSWEYNDKGGRMIYGMVQDITQQTALEYKEEAGQRDLLFKNKVLQLNEQAAHIGHWTINLLTRKIVYSDNVYRLFGLKPGTLPASTALFLNYVHPEDRERVETVTKNILKQQILPDIDFRILRNDGKVRHMRQRGKMAVYGENEIAMIVTLQDVSAEMTTAQKIAELKLEISLQQAAQRQAEEMANMGSFYWEVQTDKFTWSDTLFELLGVKPGTTELTQKHLVRNIYPDDRKRFTDELNQTIQEKLESKFEFRMLRHGEIRWICASFRLIDFAGKALCIGILEDITKDKELEQELAVRVSQAEYITENMLSRTIITDAENTVVIWNKRCEEAYGLKKENVIGRNIFEVFPQLKNETDISLFNRALNGERITAVQVKSVLRQESHDLHMIPIKDEHGNVTGILHLLHDVSKERAMQLRLSERLNFIESLMEASMDRIIVMDRYMNYLYCNQKAAHYFGLRKEDIIGKNVLEIFPSSVNDPSYEHFRKALKGESIHMPAIAGSANEHYYDVFLIPIKDDSDAVSAVLWIHHDLSREIKIQQQINKADELLNAINEAYAELDNEGVIRFVNRRAEEIWNIPKEALLGKTIWDVFSESVGLEGYQVISKALQEKVPVSGEYYLHNAARWLYISATPSNAGVIILFYDISEIKAARNDLEEEHRRLKEAQTIGRIGSIEWTVGEDTVLWSDEMYRICGMEPQQEPITIAMIYSLLVPDEKESFLQLQAQALQSPGQYQFYHCFLAKTGIKRWVNCRFESVADAAATIVRIYGTVQDITERREAEIELKESARFIQSLTGATADILSVMNLHTKEITYTNRPVTAVLGYTKSQVEKLPAPFFDVMDSRDRAAMLQHIDDMKTAAPGEVREIEYRMVSADGSVKWYKDRSVVFERDNEGNALSRIGISEDITDRKGREDELFKNLNLLQQAEDIAGVGSWEYRTGAQHMDWSEGMYQLFDLDQGTKVKPETYLEYAVPEERPVARNIVKALTQGAAMLDEILTIETRQGVRKVLKIKGVAVQDTVNKVVRMLGVDLDITGQVQTEEMLKALNHSLNQRNKELEAKNEELAHFSFIASHDLREPLRKIHTFSDWLLQRETANLSELGKDYLQRMAFSVVRMDRLIDDVLILTQIHAAAFEKGSEVNLNLILSQVKKELAEPIKETKAMITSGVLPHIRGNKEQLHHLFLNLMSNSIKFQDAGSTPHLTIKSTEATPKEIAENGLIIEKSYVKICFTDNGIGFEKKYYARIFNIFQRLHAHKEFDGTGIGLTICKKVMANHYGAISVESKPGKGTTFCCYFPA